MVNQVFEVYMKEGCPYSQAAKDKLEQLGLAVETWVVPSDQLEALKKRHKMSTYPHIFVRTGNTKTLIGGYDDLENYLEYNRHK